MLNAEQRTELERRVRAGTSFQRDAVRARIILACEERGSASAIAQRVGVHARTVERWRVRFQRHGLAGLHDRPRPGPPPKFGPVTRLELIALACEPVVRRRGRTTRTIADLVREAEARGIVDAISWSSYQRLLAAVDLRPHRIQGWVHSPDPAFRAKVAEITDLYLRPPAGAVVLSIDEKTGMQALEATLPRSPAVSRPSAPARIRIHSARDAIAVLRLRGASRSSRRPVRAYPNGDGSGGVHGTDRRPISHGPRARDLGQSEHPLRRPSAAVECLQRPPRS